MANFTDKTPVWALEDTHLDKNGNKKGDPLYDPSTLLIPPGSLSKVTSTMQQFWEIKSENYDKLVLFKLGKFYELFYEDALKAVRICGLKWMGTKMHSGFPEKSLEKYATELTKAGEKVVVV